MKNLFFILLINFFSIFPNISDGQIPLDYDEIGIRFTPKKGVDTIELSTTKFNKNFKCVINLKNLLGACDFKIYDTKGILFLEGHYSNCHDTLTKYRFSKRLGLAQKNRTIYGVTLYKYYYPLKTGQWIYYDRKGKVKEQYFYEYEMIE